MLSKPSEPQNVFTSADTIQAHVLRQLNWLQAAHRKRSQSTPLPLPVRSKVSRTATPLRHSNAILRPPPRTLPSTPSLSFTTRALRPLYSINTLSFPQCRFFQSHRILKAYRTLIQLRLSKHYPKSALSSALCKSPLFSIGAARIPFDECKSQNWF